MLRRLSLIAAVASAWSVSAQAQQAQQIVLTSPDIQTGTSVSLLTFSGNAARAGVPNIDGARQCGLNKIVKYIDSSSPQFFAALFNMVPISAASIASSFQGGIFYQVDLTGVTVDEIVRSVSDEFFALQLQTQPALNNYLTETITLHATTVKYTYQPTTPTGQKNGPPIIFGWNCQTNTAF